MELTSIYGEIVDLIGQQYPARHYPAENAYLSERYSYEPAVTPQLNAAVDRCLSMMSSLARRNPQLDENETREIALDRFLEKFAQTIHDEAEAIFDGLELL